MTRNDEALHALILAGGRGARFWPLSRKARPKQCLDLDGQGSPLARTLQRLDGLIPPERIWVVTGRDMEAAVRAELPGLSPEHILVEPSGRNTAPCIAWGTQVIGRGAGDDAVVAVLPADHAIRDAPGFRALLASATDAARQTGAIVTLGIKADRPATGFGYLEQGAEMGEWGGRRFHLVQRFTEKPDRITAEALIATGRQLWNAGIFVYKVGAMEDALRAHLPATAQAMIELGRDPGRIADVWGRTDATSIDFGVMERLRHILTVEADVGWSDMGSWDEVGDQLPALPGGRGRARRIVSVDSEGCVVHALDKAVALVGLRDLVVVDTPDALLVMDRRRAQDLREVLRQLAASGEDGLT